MKFPFIVKLVLNKYFFQKFIAIAFLALFLTIFQDFFLIFLFTFLFAFLFLDLTKWLQEKMVTGLQNTKSTLLSVIRTFFVSESRVVSLIYFIFVCLIIFLFSSLIPQLLAEGKGLLRDIPGYFRNIESLLKGFESNLSIHLGLSENLGKFLSPESIESAIKGIIENLKNIGLFLIKLLIALILSFVFIHDRIKIMQFLHSMKNGSFGFFYDEYEIVFEKISRGFGLIFKAQALIAGVNAVLTTLGLLLISLFHQGGAFPYITTITIMVFIFGFIPVLGFIISSIPILLLSYNFGGWEVVLLVVLMVGIVHAIEAYYLNPKIVSSYMDFPVFVTFLILLVSEHFFGFIGLLVGVPLFYILLDILGDFDIYVTKISRITQTVDTLKTDTTEALKKNIRLSRSQGLQDESHTPE